jgi:hypothetical protein
MPYSPAGAASLSGRCGARRPAICLADRRGAWKRVPQAFLGFRFPDLRHQSITRLAKAGVECPADRSVFQWPTSNFEILSTPVPCGLGRDSM